MPPGKGGHAVATELAHKNSAAKKHNAIARFPRLSGCPGII
jgi:hypothetical protein